MICNKCGHISGAIICANSRFRCNNGECIEVSKRCDSRKDCEDNSDEIDCGKYSDFLLMCFLMTRECIRMILQ